ncbi:MAG: MOSC domain-containing protein [Myxococcota bacterium]
MKPKLADLLRRVPQVGRLEWIGVRPGRGEPMATRDEVDALTDRGLDGDRKSRRRGGKRQVSLIQAEHLPIIAGLTGRDRVHPEEVRRNLVVQGINLLSLRTARFWIGEVLFEGTGHCAPCAQMEAALGPGGFSAMRGHGGILARILEGGTVRRGDEVRFVDVTVVRTPTS